MPRRKKASPYASLPSMPLIEASGPSRLNHKKLQQLYRAMQHARAKALNEGFPAGYEAVDAACTAELLVGDVVVSARPLGIDVAEKYGARVLAQSARDAALVGTGVAMVMKRTTAAATAASSSAAGREDVVFVFLPREQAVEERSLALFRLAQTQQLPIVYVASEQPGERESGADLTLEMATFVVDANDAVALYRVAQEASLRARIRLAPTLIDCRFSLPYNAEQERAFMHRATNADAELPEHDPLVFLEHYMRAKGVWAEK